MSEGTQQDGMEKPSGMSPSTITSVFVVVKTSVVSTLKVVRSIRDPLTFSRVRMH